LNGLKIQSKALTRQQKKKTLAGGLTEGAKVATNTTPATTGEGVTRGVSPPTILDKATTLRRDPNMEPTDPRVRIAVLVGALKLEVLGMKRRGRSVYAIVKDEFGLRGNKRRVLEQLQDIKERLNEPYPPQAEK
jgi:hypothetical protein